MGADRKGNYFKIENVTVIMIESTEIAWNATQSPSASLSTREEHLDLRAAAASCGQRDHFESYNHTSKRTHARKQADRVQINRRLIADRTIYMKHKSRSRGKSRILRVGHRA